MEQFKDVNRRKSKHKEKLNIAMFGQKRIPSREGGVEIVVEELCSRMVAQPFMYRNWLVEGVGFYYMGKWIRKHECQRKTLSIGMLIIGSIVTTAEYRICGRLEFYFGNLPMVYGMLALGKAVHIKDNILSMIGSKHSLHLYLYSPFVACVFSLLQMILFQTTRHQEIITVLVIFGTTWLVMQGWFIKAIEKLKIA